MTHCRERGGWARSVKDGNVSPICAIMSLFGRTYHPPWASLIMTALLHLYQQYSVVLQNCVCTNMGSAPWLRPTRPTFDPRPAPVAFVVDRLALGQISLPALWFFHPCSRCTLGSYSHFVHPLPTLYHVSN
jgi:hypothetical protein